MFLLISPAKTLNYSDPSPVASYTVPEQLDKTQQLIDELKQYTPDQIAKLMKVSDKIAHLNFDRFQEYDVEKFNFDEAKQAIFAYQGDVYRGLDASSLSVKALQFAQKHLGILSGLYGLLHPLDLMLPYRLEMKTKVPCQGEKDLYGFWGDVISEQINAATEKMEQPVIVNLASEEYAKSVKAKVLNAPMIKVDFKEWKEGDYKTIGIYAKYARGLMARYVCEHQITDLEALKNFDSDGYAFNVDLSTDTHFIFTRNLV